MSAKTKVLKAFYAITDSSHHYQDKWISDQGLVEILTTHSPTNVKDIENLRTVVVRSLNSLAGKFDSSNVNKVYVATFFTHCPFTLKKRLVYYYFRGINKIPTEPSSAADISCAYASSHRMSNNRARGLPTIQKQQEKKEQLDGHPTALATVKTTGAMRHPYAKQC